MKSLTNLLADSEILIYQKDAVFVGVFEWPHIKTVCDSLCFFKLSRILLGWNFSSIVRGFTE